MKFRAAVVDYQNSVQILACELDAGGNVFKTVKPVELVQTPEENFGRLILEPTMQLKLSEAQSLLDALLDAGMRPTNLSNPSGEIQRINDHLQDMRKLVFKDTL